MVANRNVFNAHKIPATESYGSVLDKAVSKLGVAGFNKGSELVFGEGGPMIDEEGKLINFDIDSVSHPNAIPTSTKLDSNANKNDGLDTTEVKKEDTLRLTGLMLGAVVLLGVLYAK